MTHRSNLIRRKCPAISLLVAQSHKSLFWLMYYFPETRTWCCALCVAQVYEPASVVLNSCLSLGSTVKS